MLGLCVCKHLGTLVLGTIHLLLLIILSLLSVVAPDFFCGGIKGAKCNSEWAKIQKIAENDWFWQFFSSDGGKWGGGEASNGGQMPPCPPLMPPLKIELLIERCLLTSTKLEPGTYNLFQSLSIHFAEINKTCLFGAGAKPNTWYHVHYLSKQTNKQCYISWILLVTFFIFLFE